MFDVVILLRTPLGFSLNFSGQKFDLSRAFHCLVVGNGAITYPLVEKSFVISIDQVRRDASRAPMTRMQDASATESAIVRASSRETASTGRPRRLNSSATSFDVGEKAAVPPA